MWKLAAAVFFTNEILMLSCLVNCLMMSSMRYWCWNRIWKWLSLELDRFGIVYLSSRCWFECFSRAENWDDRPAAMCWNALSHSMVNLRQKKTLIAKYWSTKVSNQGWPSTETQWREELWNWEEFLFGLSFFVQSTCQYHGSGLRYEKLGSWFSNHQFAWFPYLHSGATSCHTMT